MINATACFLRNNNKTLLLYRHKGKGDIHYGYYIPPGGRTERGERGIDCIIREFEEETGLILESPKLRVIASFYNQRRILGGQKNPEDWHVEIYEATDFRGVLREEHPKANLFWIDNFNLKSVKMYPGDRKIMDLMKQEGVFEVLCQYSKEDLIRFESDRVY